MNKLNDSGKGLSLKMLFLWSIIVVIFFILLGIVVMFVAMPYYNDGRALGIPFLILLSGISLLIAFVGRKQKLRVENTATTPINTLSSGDVEIAGKVKAVGKTIISPTSQNCVYYDAYWYDTVVVNPASENPHTTAVQVDHEVRSSSFVIIDQYGEAELDLHDVDLNNVQRHREQVWIYEFNSIITCDNSKRNPIGGRISDRYQELNLKAGDNFYYNGVIEESECENETGIAALPPIVKEQPPLLTEIPTGVRKWKLKGGIIGNKSEEQIKNKFKNVMVISFVVSVVFLVFAVILHFLPLDTIQKFME